MLRSKIFEYYTPATLQDALQILSNNPDKGERLADRHKWGLRIRHRKVNISV
jgi:hypothetical protein